MKILDQDAPTHAAMNADSMIDKGLARALHEEKDPIGLDQRRQTFANSRAQALTGIASLLGYKTEIVTCLFRDNDFCFVA